MRILCEFSPREKTVKFPLAYNSMIQGFLYHGLSDSLAHWLHNEGVTFEKRHFRLFTFSRLFGKYKIADGTIEFSGPFRLHVGSVHNEMLQSLATHLLRSPSVQIGKEFCDVKRIEVEASPDYHSPAKVRTLSPITVYSTLETPEGKKKTYYYSPFEREWEEQLLANLKRKALALSWEKSLVEQVEGGRIRSFRVTKRDLRIMKYRNTVIKAWTGLYEIDLPEAFFRLAYDSGLGAKNAQGFGCITLGEPPVREQNRRRGRVEKTHIGSAPKGRKRDA
jgi:CRISPR-associated endoribonuclease Cas6